MRAPEVWMIEVVIELHALHVSRSIIAKLTGYPAMYVGKILFDVGRHERWHHIADVRADLPLALREACDNLMSANGARPLDSRKALAIARRPESSPATLRNEASR
jgi:hypothetical protein